MPIPTSGATSTAATIVRRVLSASTATGRQNQTNRAMFEPTPFGTAQSMTTAIALTQIVVRR